MSFMSRRNTKRQRWGIIKEFLRICNYSVIKTCSIILCYVTLIFYSFVWATRLESAVLKSGLNISSYILNLVILTILSSIFVWWFRFCDFSIMTLFSKSLESIDFLIVGDFVSILSCCFKCFVVLSLFNRYCLSYHFKKKPFARLRMAGIVKSRGEWNR